MSQPPELHRTVFRKMCPVISSHHQMSFFSFLFISSEAVLHIKWHIGVTLSSCFLGFFFLQFKYSAASMCNVSFPAYISFKMRPLQKAGHRNKERCPAAHIGMQSLPSLFQHNKWWAFITQRGAQLLPSLFMLPLHSFMHRHSCWLLQLVLIYWRNSVFPNKLSDFKKQSPAFNTWDRLNLIILCTLRHHVQSAGSLLLWF